MVWAEYSGEALDNAFNHLHFLLWPLLVLFMQKAGARLSEVESALAFTLVVLAGWYLAQRFGVSTAPSSDRFQAGVGSTGMLSTVLAFFVLWLVAAATRPRQANRTRWLLGMGALGGLVALYGTQARTELLGVALGLTGLVLFRWPERWIFKAGTVSMFVALICAFLAIYAAKDRFTVIQDEAFAYFAGPEQRRQAVHTSVGARLEMSRVAWEGVKERPLLGWGAGLRPRHLQQYATDPGYTMPYSNFHNLFLQSLLEIGVLGSVVSLGLAFWLFRETVWRVLQGKQRELGLLSLLLWFSYFWKSLANATFGYGLPNAVFVLFSAWFWVESRRAASWDESGR